MSVKEMIFQESKWFPRPRLKFKVTTPGYGGTTIFRYDRENNLMILQMQKAELLANDIFISDGRVKKCHSISGSDKSKNIYQFIRIDEFTDPKLDGYWVDTRDVTQIVSGG